MEKKNLPNNKNTQGTYVHVHNTLAEKIQECKTLLRSTQRPGIEKLITFIDRLGFFEAPGSTNHHRFVGGLVSHGLETYRKAMDIRSLKINAGVDETTMPLDSVIICGILHDLCKADVLRYDKSLRAVKELKKEAHSAKSVKLIGYADFKLTHDERDAILWHMGGKRIEHDENRRRMFFKTHPLADIINKADGQSIGESKRRHHPNR